MKGTGAYGANEQRVRNSLRRVERELDKVHAERDALAARVVAVEGAFRHIHDGTGPDDICAKCGLDLWDDIHIRVRKTAVTVDELEAILNEDGQASVEIEPDGTMVKFTEDAPAPPQGECGTKLTPDAMRALGVEPPEEMTEREKGERVEELAKKITAALAAPAPEEKWEPTLPPTLPEHGLTTYAYRNAPVVKVCERRGCGNEAHLVTVAEKMPVFYCGVNCALGRECCCPEQGPEMLSSPSFIGCPVHGKPDTLWLCGHRQSEHVAAGGCELAEEE